MVGFCIFGAGRMGQLHARTLFENDKATLQCVYDVIPAAAHAFSFKETYIFEA